MKDRVKEALEKNPMLRDSDNKLIAHIWRGDLPFNGNVLQQLEAGKLSSPESIMRCRRKIQESDPSLRGEFYGMRQSEQDKVKEDLGYAVQKAAEPQDELDGIDQDAAEALMFGKVEGDGQIKMF